MQMKKVAKNRLNAKLEHMKGLCQEPTCPKKTTLYRYTVAPGIYLWLCRGCIGVRWMLATSKHKPLFLASSK